MNRCTGHCCKRFFLAYSPAALEAMREHSRKPHRHTLGAVSLACRKDHPERCPGGDRCPSEQAVVAHMVEFVEESNIGPEGPMNPMDPSQKAHWYRCKNLLFNGDCGIYETRPKMCRDFPYGAPCRYSACEWDAVNVKSACAAKFVASWKTKTLKEAFVAADIARGLNEAET